MSNYDKYKFGISSFSLHILAMLFMLFDHVGKTILLDYSFLTFLGRFAFPIFAFLIVEGFFHTRNLSKYIFRLFIFALISEIPFNLMVSNKIFFPYHQNILWTFFISIICISIFRQTKEMGFDFKLTFYPLIIIIFFLIGMIARVDYKGFGILTVLLFYFTRVKKENLKSRKILMKIIQILGMLFISYGLVSEVICSFRLFNFDILIYKQSLSIFSLLFIWFYNREQGIYNNYIKYFYYLFYPIHMLILGILNY